MLALSVEPRRHRGLWVLGAFLAGTLLPQSAAPTRGPASFEHDGDAAFSRASGVNDARDHDRDRPARVHPFAQSEARRRPARGESRREPEPPAQALTPGAIAQRALQATVFVRVGASYGAGVLIDGGGLVLTCEHVIGGKNEAEPISVELADGQSFAATRIDQDRELDLALLQIPRAAGVAPVLSSMTTVSIGDDVFAMGAPKRMAFSLQRGMASFVGREFNGVRYLQTDLPTTGGNSGGPVLNHRGEIVALASFTLRESQGIAFALPIDYAFARFAARLGKRSDLDPARLER